MLYTLSRFQVPRRSSLHVRSPFLNSANVPYPRTYTDISTYSSDRKQCITVVDASQAVHVTCMRASSAIGLVRFVEKTNQNTISADLL